MKKFICIDIEMSELTASEKELVHGLRNEIIEIGAVMLDENFTLIKTFTSYVKPAYSSVTPIIKDLTGISNENLKDADDLVTVMDRYGAWVGDGETETFCWSSTDYNQFWNELSYKAENRQDLLELLKSFVDLQRVFVMLLKSQRNISVESALKFLCLNFDGRQHEATSDAYNTARILKKIAAGKELKLEYDFLYHCPKQYGPLSSGKYEKLRVKNSEYKNSFASFMPPELLAQFGCGQEEDEEEITVAEHHEEIKAGSENKLSREQEEELLKQQYEQDIKLIKESKLSFTDVVSMKQLCDKYKVPVSQWISIVEKTLNVEDLKS